MWLAGAPHAKELQEETVDVATVEEDQEFSTNQTVCAAYLVYCGHDIIDTEWRDGMCTFFFGRCDELNDDFGEFVQGAASVEPVSFSNAYGQVMQRVKNERPRIRRT